MLPGSAALGASQQSPALLARINDKKQELESLLALRDLSGNMAAQMEELQEKLKTLSDGTEGKCSQCAPRQNASLLTHGDCSCRNRPLELAVHSTYNCHGFQ
jgi:hypothetical protein